MSYKESEDLAALGAEVIGHNREFDHLAAGGVRIAYLACDKAKKTNGRVCYAGCEKIKEKMKGLMPYDFAITFYPDALRVPGEIRERIMYHELCHVGYDGAGEKPRYYIIRHDVEDFRDVIERWGMDWIRLKP